MLKFTSNPYNQGKGLRGFHPIADATLLKTYRRKKKWKGWKLVTQVKKTKVPINKRKLKINP
ncbi:hypothetical protein NUSPORA_02410 [Nucleospora cyclopteri]